jgi:hypothetical protein
MPHFSLDALFMRFEDIRQEHVSHFSLDALFMRFEDIRQEHISHFRLDALFMRFEEPNPNQRWDSPLFVIQPDDILPLFVSDLRQICGFFRALRFPPPI